MDPVTARLIESLPAYGPWLLFGLAVAETCFVTGLIIPSGLATSVGTVLALEGTMDLPPILLAALAGGAVGDTIGYWVGRAAGERVLHGEGRWARGLGRRATFSRLLGRHPVYSVTIARLVSFVRTLMPMAAGMTGVSYGRFLRYELVGLIVWVGFYVGIGALASESWALAIRVAGTGGAITLIALVIALRWSVRRLPRRGSRKPEPVEGRARTQDDERP